MRNEKEEDAEEEEEDQEENDDAGFCRQSHAMVAGWLSTWRKVERFG